MAAVNRPSITTFAALINSEVRALPMRNTAAVRTVRRKYSRLLKESPANFVINLAKKLIRDYGYTWVAYELIRYHQLAFQIIGEKELRRFIAGIDNWGTADAFATILSGPLWLNRRILDRLLVEWARSANRWQRRIALASTVALNRRATGGGGNGKRTLKICRLLADDRDDMVEKALSWALRELIADDRQAVKEFLTRYDDVLAARVKREVNNKLRSGLKNPKKTHQ